MVFYLYLIVPAYAGNAKECITIRADSVYTSKVKIFNSCDVVATAVWCHKLNRGYKARQCGTNGRYYQNYGTIGANDYIYTKSGAVFFDACKGYYGSLVNHASSESTLRCKNNL